MMEQPEDRPFLPNLCNGWAVLVVIVVAELMAIVLTLMGGFYKPFSFNQLAINSFFMQWVGITSAGLLCGWRQYLNRQAVAVAAVLVVLIVAADTLLFSVLAQVFKHWVNGQVLSAGLLDANVWRATLIAAILAGMTMRYFYVQEELLRRRESELKARIQSLQSRIRPHFLFNSMNIISSLIAVDPDTAEQVVEDLSQLFRASLKESEGLVELEEELDLCRRYVRIEQLRMGDRLAVEWQVDDRVLTQKIPLLMLQPLLENAIYHGIQPLPEGGKILIAASVQQGQVVIDVQNPRAKTAVATTGNRMALDNIGHRLQALHGRKGLLDVKETAIWFQVTIRFPCAGSKEG